MTSKTDTLSGILIPSNPSGTAMDFPSRFRTFFSALGAACILAVPPVGADTGYSLDLPPVPSAEDFFQVRVFAEPLVPIGGIPAPDENAALAISLRQFVARGVNEDAAALEAFLASHPGSKWNASLLCNLGTMYYRTGAFSKAVEAWGRSWELSKGAEDEYGRAVADKALGEYVRMIARIGMYERLEGVLKETATREVRGAATERLAGGREALLMMKHRPSESFMCGPIALAKVFALVKSGTAMPPAIKGFVSTHKGTSLWQVRSAARKAGLSYEAARRSSGATIPLPAIINWKVGHYAAVVGFENGRYHVQDPTFGDDLWITSAVLDSEASGYFLIPCPGRLPRGWSMAPSSEAGHVWGKGVTGSSDPGATSPGDPSSGPGCDKENGMPIYRFHLQLVNVNLRDIPVGYAPPRGPAVEFRLTYNHREAGQPAIFNFGNVGNKWTHDWITFLTDDPANPAGDVARFYSGGGTEMHSGFVSATSSYAPSTISHSVLARTSASPVKYERRMPDGSIEYFEKVDGATAFPRRIFLTKKSDPQGQSLTFTYDTQFRLTTVTDALGQNTVLTYGLAADTRKVTKVTDPFGRAALIEYNAAKQISKLTDVLGLATTFTYSSGDFISSMITPYGTTSFRAGENAGEGYLNIRWAEVTDAAGNRERLEFRHLSPFLKDKISPPPSSLYGALPENEASTLYWDKKAMADGAADYNTAHIYSWCRLQPTFHVSSSIMAWDKPALESPRFYHYKGQTGTNSTDLWMMNVADMITRIMDDGSEQKQLLEYNSVGNATKYTDPLGRSTTYDFAANGVDLLKSRQTTAGANMLLGTYTYNSQHRPLTYVDAAGQKTTYTYNAQGQMLTEANAKNEVTTYVYNAAGYMTKIQRPQVADSVKLTYDAFGRVATRREADGYTLAFAYDALDRLIQITFPDGTTRKYAYNKLDLETETDRRGVSTKTFHNPIRQPVLVQDAAQRMTNLEWCSCGELKSLTDPNGNKTQWKRDVQGRVQEKVYADGRKLSFAWEAKASRLASWTDAKGQKRAFEYFLDDNLKKITYTGSVVPTPAVSYTYDAQFNRLKTMADGTGTTTLAYNAITATPALGAGRLASMDGPITNDLISFSYDQLGRIITRNINGSVSTQSYDNLGRVTSIANPLGSFTYKYLTPMDRPDSLIYPNGQKAAFAYAGATGDFRLTQIKNMNSPTLNISKFDYAYDAESRIKTWTEQADAGVSSIHNYSYDAVDQLTGDITKSSATGNPVTKHFAYAYDKAGNRTSAQESGTVNTYGYNSVNQLVSQSAGGKMRFLGTVSEPATVTVAGSAATVSSTKEFEASATVINGKTTVAVTAKDYSNNSRTNKYEITAAGSAKAFTYDLNGNMTGDGVFTYEWDAEDRLTAVVKGALRSEFTYDGSSRRVRIVEKNGATVLSDKRLLWVGNEIAEGRDGAGTGVTKRYYRFGVLAGTTKLFYTMDHLGSVRELTDNSKSVVARYAYDAYGIRTKVSGTQSADFGFTGFYQHEPSGLALTLFRAYNPGLGRWISRDPIQEAGGINLYGYVHSSPINLVDPFGLYALPDFQQDAVNFSAGFGDAIFFGFGDEMRGAFGIDGGVDKCSNAYSGGGWATFGLGVGRIGYAVAAKGAAGLAASAEKAVANRNTLKWIFRGFTNGSYRRYTFKEMMEKYGTEEAVKAAAGRTSPAWNSAGASAAAGGAASSAGCSCDE